MKQVPENIASCVCPAPSTAWARPGDPVAPVFRNLPLTLALGRGLQAMWKGWPLSLWLHQTDVT